MSMNLFYRQSITSQERRYETKPIEKGKGFRTKKRHFHLCWECGYSWISNTDVPVRCAYKPCSSDTWYVPRTKLNNQRLFTLHYDQPTEKQSRKGVKNGKK